MNDINIDKKSDKEKKKKIDRYKSTVDILNSFGFVVWLGIVFVSMLMYGIYIFLFPAYIGNWQLSFEFIYILSLAFNIYIIVILWLSIKFIVDGRSDAYIFTIILCIISIIVLIYSSIYTILKYDVFSVLILTFPIEAAIFIAILPFIFKLRKLCPKEVREEDIYE